MNNGKEPEQEFVEVTSTLAEITSSSLSVHVDYLELVDRYDEDKAWEILSY